MSQIDDPRGRQASYHRTVRNVFAVAAVVTFFANLALHHWVPAVAPYLLGNADWIWTLAVVAYHAGWLKRNKLENSDDH